MTTRMKSKDCHDISSLRQIVGHNVELHVGDTSRQLSMAVNEFQPGGVHGVSVTSTTQYRYASYLNTNRVRYRHREMAMHRVL